MGASTGDIFALRAAALRELDRVCTQFEAAWKSGRRPLLEQFWADSSSDQDEILLRELLLVELDYRRRIGELPTQQEYLRRFPGRAVAIGEVWSASTAESAPPDIAGYQIVRRLGRGGMAAVYLALDKQLGRQVALKLINAADPDERAVARFVDEAHAIARLQHPNIVQIYQIAQHNAQPYLALEYVGGGTLAQWIGGNPRTPPEAARIVQTLAGAVQAAHQQGIVHRDLKPANVLLQSGKFIPKITDFGLAKFIDVDARQTQSGMVIGTASYMAPEQAGGSDVGPGADIYALGAILYELLTGRPPFKAATVLETTLLVRHSEPVAPRQLQPGTPRDLENICLKCLEKDPARRYASALDLAEDLTCFLSDRPVAARPVSSIDHLRRWTRRNRAVAALLVVVGAVLIAGTAVSGFFAVRSARRAAENLALADRNRALAEQERRALNTAQTSEKQAQKVLRYLVNTFQSADPLQGGKLTVAESLGRAVAFLDKDFADDPIARAQVTSAIGEAYVRLGMIKDGTALLERAQALLGPEMPADDQRMFNVRRALASAYRAAGDHPRALAMARVIYQQLRATLGDDHADTVEAANTLAMILQETGALAEAGALHEFSLDWTRRHLGETDPATLTAMNNLAWIYLRTDRVDDAIDLYERALGLSRTILGEDHPSTLAKMNGLAQAYVLAGRSEAAIAMFERVLHGARKQLGDDHPNTLLTMGSLARAYRENGQLEKATQLTEQTLALKRGKLGEDHPDTLNELAALAVVYDKAGKMSQALPIYEQVLKKRRAKLGDEHPDTLRSWSGLGQAYRQIGDLQRAQQTLRESFQIRSRVLPDDPSTYLTAIQLGGVLVELNRFAEAERLTLANYQHISSCKPFALRSRYLADAAKDISNLYERWNKPEEAAVWRAKLP